MVRQRIKPRERSRRLWQLAAPTAASENRRFEGAIPVSTLPRNPIGCRRDALVARGRRRSAGAGTGRDSELQQDADPRGGDRRASCAGTQPGLAGPAQTVVRRRRQGGQGLGFSGWRPPDPDDPADDLARTARRDLRDGGHGRNPTPRASRYWPLGDTGSRRPGVI